MYKYGGLMTYYDINSLQTIKSNYDVIILNNYYIKLLLLLPFYKLYFIFIILILPYFHSKHIITCIISNTSVDHELKYA